MLLQTLLEFYSISLYDWKVPPLSVSSQLEKIEQMTYELITVLHKASKSNNVNSIDNLGLGLGLGLAKASARALIALGPLFQLSSLTIR